MCERRSAGGERWRVFGVAESLQAESVWGLCIWYFADVYAEATLDPHDPICNTACKVNSSGCLYS